MKILSGVIEHIILVSILLTIFTQNYFRIKYSSESELIDRIITNITINLAIFTVTNYMLSFIGLKTKHIYLGMTILIAFLIAVNCIRIIPVALDGRIRSRIIPIVFLIGPALSIPIWQYIPTLTLLDSTASSLNMTSIGNNDIANYALAAKEYLYSGFINSGRYPDLDFNSYARDLQHLTVHLLISFTSFVSNLPVWKIMNSVMIFTIALNAIVLIKMFKAISKNRKPLLPIIAVSISLLNPFNSYVIHHYFLSQSLSLLILSLIIIKGHEIYNKNHLKLVDGIEITSLMILSIFSYPSILIPAIFGVFVVNLINEKFFKKEGFKPIAQKYLTVIIFAFLGCILSIIYLPRAFNILYLHATIRSGWELPAPNAIGIFFSPFYISNSINSNISKLIWFGFLCATLGIFYLSMKAKRANMYFISLISTIIFVYILQVIIRGQGFGHYQNWKLLSYIMPIVVVIVLAEFCKVSNKGPLIMLPFLIGGIISPISLWKNGNDFGTLSIINKELIELQKVKDIYKIDGLNVMIGPYYQSMAVGLVTDVKKIYFSSPTYYPINSDKNLCSLVENSDDRFPNKVEINESYSLISSENLKCDVVNPDNLFKISENIKIVFDKSNIQNRQILDRGWSYPEVWGTWAIGQNSTMRFNLSQVSPLGSFINFNIIWPFPKTVKYSESTITLNGVIIGKLDSSSNNDAISLKVFNLKTMNNIITFTNLDPVSPKTLGISEDQRPLSIGITNFSVSKF